MRVKTVTYFSQKNNQFIEVEFIEAEGSWKWFFDLFNFAAMVLPERKVIVCSFLLLDQELIDHELIHIERMERMGAVRFYFMYCLLFLRYGYEDHPYEIEARQHEH